MSDTQERRAPRPNAQLFDVVIIGTVPRYKSSQYSGDEWRISHQTIFFRNGQPVHTASGGIEYAKENLEDFYTSADAMARIRQIESQDYCDQVGCEEKSTKTYRLLKLFDKEGKETDPYAGEDKRPLVRKFCDRHSKRGNCGLEDADRNYEWISGGPPVEPVQKDVKQSVLLGAVNVEYLSKVFN